MSELRAELPRLPRRMRALPVDRRGYPVPYFVAWLDGGKPSPRGQGEPDFRIIAPGRVAECWRERRCWICGQGIRGRRAAFTIGPMCAINRTSAEPPAHIDCSDFAARACPFLARPHARRRENALPAGRVEAAGIPLSRNPGVALVWISSNPKAYRPRAGGVLFDVGEPLELRFYAEGRPATRAEIDASIESGLPALAEVAAAEGALEELEEQLEVARELLPA